MRLLLLTDDPDPDAVLPALALLTHTMESAPLAEGSLTRHSAADVDMTIIDARTDLTAARKLCQLLAAMDTSVPIVALLNEGGLVAVTAKWRVADILLPYTGPAEIDTRLRLLMGRRSASANQEADGIIRHGELVIHQGTYVVTLRERPIQLTFKEFELLKYLVRHPGRVFTRQQLLQAVWGYDFFGGSRTVDVHVRRLRAKLGPQPNR